MTSSALLTKGNEPTTRLLVCFVGLAFAAYLAGCGGDTRESLAKDLLSSTKEIASSLSEVKDEPSAKAANSKLKSLSDRVNTIKERLSKLGPPKPDEVDAKKAMYGSKEMRDAQHQIFAERRRIAFNPKMQAELNDIDFQGVK